MEHGWRLWILVRTSKRGVAWRIQVPLGLHGLWGGHVELVAHQVGLALHLGPLVAPMARWRWDGTSREVKELMVRVDVLEGATFLPLLSVVRPYTASCSDSLNSSHTLPEPRLSWGMLGSSSFESPASSPLSWNRSMEDECLLCPWSPPSAS